MRDPTAKPSGSLWSSTAPNRMNPSGRLTRKPDAIATPSKNVWMQSPARPRYPTAGWTRASWWISSPKWKCGVSVCSVRCTTK